MMRLLDDGQQRSIVEKIATSESGCRLQPDSRSFAQWLERGGEFGIVIGLH